MLLIGVFISLCNRRLQSIRQKVCSIRASPFTPYGVCSCPEMAPPPASLNRPTSGMSNHCVIISYGLLAEQRHLEQWTAWSNRAWRSSTYYSCLKFNNRKYTLRNRDPASKHFELCTAVNKTRSGCVSKCAKQLAHSSSSTKLWAHLLFFHPSAAVGECWVLMANRSQTDRESWVLCMWNWKIVCTLAMDIPVV